MRLLTIVILLLALSGCATTPDMTLPPRPYATGGVYHTVKSGETLWGIARLYDVDLKSLLRANSISADDLISRGQRIYIPGAYKTREYKGANLATGMFGWPVKGPIIAYFGSRVNNAKIKGIDIKADEGANVRASRAGKVVFCDDKLKGFGKTVILDHGDNYRTVYAYNSDILVKVGDSVVKNDVIAKVGRTGRAKEPSLHFEIRRGSEPENPLYYLPR